MVQWFGGLYFCPAGTPESPCDFKVKDVLKFGKHVMKDHNLHYASFGGKRKLHRCKKCSASSDDLEVITAHNLKLHSSGASSNNFPIMPTNFKFQMKPLIIETGSSSVSRVEVETSKSTRTRHRKPSKAKKALYTDSKPPSNQNSRGHTVHGKTSVDNPTRYQPVTRYRGIPTGSNTQYPSQTEFNFRQTSAAPSQDYSKLLAFQPQQSTMAASQNIGGQHLRLQPSIKENVKERSDLYSKKLYSTRFVSYNQLLDNDSYIRKDQTPTIQEYNNKQRSIFESPENGKLYKSLLSLSPKLRKTWDDNNNDTTLGSPKSGLSTVEEAIRGLQSRVHAGAFQPGTSLSCISSY